MGTMNLKLHRCFSLFIYCFVVFCFLFGFLKVLQIVNCNIASAFFLIMLLQTYIPFQIDEWLEYACIFSSGSKFETACGYVDDYLLRRTFLVGYSLSIADIAIWSGLAGNQCSSAGLLFLLIV